MIVLQGSELVVRIDPDHGGEILDLVDGRTGRQLLGRPPFAPADRVGGDLDEATWTGAYRGGWQLLAPNAGNACEVGGAPHGFHGRASADPWSVTEVSTSSVVLAWAGHGLAITRTLRLEAGGLEITTAFDAERGSVPFVSVEHCSVGLEVLDPVVELRLPAGLAYELSETSGPPTPLRGAASWPTVDLLDGTAERGDRLCLDTPRGRFHVVANLPAGNAEIVNGRTGVGLALDWDVDALPHLWVWHEARASGGLWRGQAEILAVEPASVPHSLGLATAIDNDQALWVEPGAPRVQRIRARPLRGGNGVIA